MVIIRKSRISVRFAHAVASSASISERQLRIGGPAIRAARIHRPTDEKAEVRLAIWQLLKNEK
jgi:hypothetical protein